MGASDDDRALARQIAGSMIDGLADAFAAARKAGYRSAKDFFAPMWADGTPEAAIAVMAKAEGAAAERARIVAWLRDYAALTSDEATMAHPLGRAPGLPLQYDLAEYLAETIEEHDLR